MGHKPQASAILEWCSKFLHELQESVVPKQTGQQREATRWTPPVRGSFKINIDAGVKVGEGIAGLSSVIRDHEGRLYAATNSFVQKEITPLQGELQAMLTGLQASHADAQVYIHSKLKNVYYCHNFHE
ncbi:hypothetical protein G4B88_027786 [Cannabis sativa]|uniref:RNase H type-1 domain-containing protein n=1 Tax=Cannabis sativa TaxID=3483 RepID=A0A7J6EHN4_CANSA|nr:hypothetical protein G4B88_027786 [Cannabis sativa]